MTGRTAETVVVPRVARLKSVPPHRDGGAAGSNQPLRSLHLNESPSPPSGAVVAAMQAAASGLNRYPDHDGSALVDILSVRAGIPADRIVIGSGSNELLYASADVALDPDDEAMAPAPGFPTYAKTIALRGARYVPVPTRPDGIVDVEATLAAVTERTRLVFVASPQNPTGGMMRADEIERLALGLPDGVLLHFDEAYHEFARHDGGPDALPILAGRSGPWIATRSFSKAFGLAGARLGYGFCSSRDLADAYRAIRINFSVNAIALAGAVAALGDEAALAGLLERNSRERGYLTGRLRALGLEVLPSAANFVSFVTPRPAGDIAAALKAENILVLPFPWRDAPGAIRVTVAGRDDMAAFADALARILVPG